MRALLAVVLALALAAPASAIPVAGDGSFRAPVLAPGRYKDTLRGGEQFFYAVNLKPASS